MHPYVVFSKKNVKKDFVNNFSINLQKFKQTQNFQRILKKYDIKQPKNRISFDIFLK